MMEWIGAFFAGRHRYEAELNTLRIENGQLRAKLVAAAVGFEAAKEEAAAERLRHAAKDEHIAALLRSLDKARAEAGMAREKQKVAEKVRDLSRVQTMTFRDAVELFADRYKIAPIELSQLGLGTFVPETDDKPASILFGDLEDAKSSIDFAMHNQATVAKFRQLKQHFQDHQAAVTQILDGLNALGKKNHVTKEDLRRLGEIRKAVSGMIGRTI